MRVGGALVGKGTLNAATAKPASHSRALAGEHAREPGTASLTLVWEIMGGQPGMALPLHPVSLSLPVNTPPIIHTCEKLRPTPTQASRACPSRSILRQ